MAKKSKWKKRLRIGCLGSFVLIVVLSQIATSCVDFSMSDKKVAEFFAKSSKKPRSEFYEVDGYEMHYKVMETSPEATVVFIHGTPGSWDAFISYFKDSALYNQATIISPDRPGFGKSSYGKPRGKLEDQILLLKPILEKYPAPRVLIGHSLGGPIAVRMAMDYPDLVEGMILLAPALDPKLEPNEDWFRVPMRWPIIEGIFPRVFRVSNEELIFLEEELELMMPMWGEVRAETVIIQGAKDRLVHPGNGPFADSMLVNSSRQLIMLDSQNHFLPWNEYKLVRETTLDMLKKLKSNKIAADKSGQ